MEEQTFKFELVRRGRCFLLGHDVPHMGGVVPMNIVTEMRYDPKDIVPYLFAQTDPDFHKTCRPGDVIVTGRNFGMGPKMQGYIAMQALGLGLVCESMPFLAYREAISLGLPVLTNALSVSTSCASGDDLEVNFETGRFINHTQNTTQNLPPIPDSLREIVRIGGTKNWLKQWWEIQLSNQI